MKLPKGWSELDRPTEDLAWRFMYDHLGFRPSINPLNWPGIKEPSPSETYSFGYIYQEAILAEQLEIELNGKVLLALQKILHSGEHLIVLDWQHNCFYFDPTVCESDNLDSWPVFVLPNGDYYIFLASDFRFGIFGHPWEQTICCFGSEFLEAIQEDPPRLFRKTIRRNGSRS